MYKTSAHLLHRISYYLSHCPLWRALV